MPSTMILTICISMVLKRNLVYHWTLGLVMREQNTKLITLTTNLKSWIQSLPQTDAEAAQVGKGKGLRARYLQPLQIKDAILHHYYSLSLLLL